MPPHSALASPATSILMAMNQPSFEATFLHQAEDDSIRAGDQKKAQLASLSWNDALLLGMDPTLAGLSTAASAALHRLNVKTHVFKKELQEYVPTQIEDRLRIETIIYVELSIVDHNNQLVSNFDYVSLPKEFFFVQPDKVMPAAEMASKRIIDVSASLLCPSNGWQEEKEACVRCARRMSTKLDQTESRIMHMIPELYRTDDGKALISFRNGIANIQFKINCYCGHKKEKEGFVVRFDCLSDTSISSHVTLPLMFYHQNKSRIASRAAKALAKAEAEQQQQQQQQQQKSSLSRVVVKSVSSSNKREPRRANSTPRSSHIPSPPTSQADSPTQWLSSPELDEFIDSSDVPVAVPSPPPPDPLISLFPDLVDEQQQQTQQGLSSPAPVVLSHMTPNSGPVRGGTLVTIHGSGFTVGQIMYVCFGDNIVPVMPQRDHMLECITPAARKADTVPVFVMNDSPLQAEATPTSFTYVDDNEKELMRLALQRMMNLMARLDGPVDTVASRATEFVGMWNEILGGDLGSSDSSPRSYDLQKMVIQSLELLDAPAPGKKNNEALSMVNSTGHSMLHLAVALQYGELVRELLVRQVPVDLRDKNGLTALDLARVLNHENMVELLTAGVHVSGRVDASLSSSTALALKACANLLAMDIPMEAREEDDALHFEGKVDVSIKSDEVARSLKQLQSPGGIRDHSPLGIMAGRNHVPLEMVDGVCTGSSLVSGLGGHGGLDGSSAMLKPTLLSTSPAGTSPPSQIDTSPPTPHVGVVSWDAFGQGAPGLEGQSTLMGKSVMGQAPELPSVLKRIPVYHGDQASGTIVDMVEATGKQATAVAGSRGHVPGNSQMLGSGMMVSIMDHLTTPTQGEASLPELAVLTQHDQVNIVNRERCVASVAESSSLVPPQDSAAHQEMGELVDVRRRPRMEDVVVVDVRQALLLDGQAPDQVVLSASHHTQTGVWLQGSTVQRTRGLHHERDIALGGMPVTVDVQNAATDARDQDEMNGQDKQEQPREV
ncbi:SPT3 Dosage dependent suppressor of Ty-induced promoter mutations-like protein [Actinomortierella ambigua]|nr:SPT3 Dosage dependent suppressor of Ty-induced promoter mutations-like protein [Actinomortierella ambigua]